MSEDQFWIILIALCGLGWGAFKAFKIHVKLLGEIRESLVSMEFAQRKARGNDWPDLR